MAALNFHHLRLFKAVAEEGGLTRAAARLHLSPSALSTQVQRLELALGHPLFERRGRGLVLTEAGRIASDYASAVFDTGEELVSALAGLPRGDRRVLRVGAVNTLSRNFQLAFLQPLIGREDTRLILRSGPSRELMGLLDQHRLDVVLSTTPPPHEEGPARQHRLLDRQPVSLVGPTLAETAGTDFPHALHGRTLILPGPDSELRHRFDDMLHTWGVEPVIIAEVDDMAMLRLLSRDSGAITLTPTIVVRDELDSGRLVEHWRVPNLWENFYAITQRRRYKNALLEEVLRTAAAGASD